MFTKHREKLKNRVLQGILLSLLLVLSACGSDTLPEPIGIGRDIDQLKRSPCACMEVQQDYSDWMQKGPVS